VSETPIPAAELADLRRAYAALLRPGSPACPPAEALADGILGELSADEQLGVADHVVACRRCAEDWRLLAETHAAASRPRASRLRPALSVAAALLLAVAGVLLVSRRGPGAAEALRGGSERSDEAITPRAGARLAEPPAELAWRAPAGAERQSTRLYDASGRRIWQGEPAAESRAAIPESIRASLADGDYFWTVEVEGGSGTSRLGPFPFSIARRARR
jgi:hypothetical protein